MEEFNIPGELVGGGGGAALLAFIVWFSNRWLNRWTKNQETNTKTLVAIELAMVAHNTESKAIMKELSEARRENAEQTKALILLVDRSSHWPGPQKST